MPSQQQRRTRLDEELPEAALLDEDHHAVKGEQHAEQGGHVLGGDHVAEIQQIVRRERGQGRRQCDPAGGDEPAKGEVGRHGAQDEEDQHQGPGGTDLRRKIVTERRHRQLQQHVAADREAIVCFVGKGAVVVQGEVAETQEAVLRRQVRGDRQVVRRRVAVYQRPIEKAPVVAGQEHGRQGEQQEEERDCRPRREAAPPPGSPGPRGRRRSGGRGGHVRELFLPKGRDTQDRSSTVFDGRPERAGGRVGRRVSGPMRQLPVPPRPS